MLGSSSGSGAGLRGASRAVDDVIDLTADSDEEDIPLRTQIPSFSGGKRRERSPTESSDGHKRARMEPVNGRSSWGRSDESLPGGSGGYRAEGNGSGTHYGVRSSFSSNQLPALQIGGYRGSSAHISPPSTSAPLHSPPLPSPPFHSIPTNGLHLPPLQFLNGRQPASNTTLPPPSRPDWRRVPPPPPKSPPLPDYRPRYDSYDNSRW